MSMTVGDAAALGRTLLRSVAKVGHRRVGLAGWRPLLDGWGQIADNDSSAVGGAVANVRSMTDLEILLYRLTSPELLLPMGAVTAVLIVVYAVTLLKKKSNRNAQSASDLLTNFREMHAQGGLSDEEYRTIKSRLTSRVHAELKDSEHRG